MPFIRIDNCQFRTEDVKQVFYDSLEDNVIVVFIDKSTFQFNADEKTGGRALLAKLEAALSVPPTERQTRRA